MARTSRSFGPERRVKRRRDFLRIQSSGRKYRTPHLLLITMTIPQSDSERPAKCRLGVTITTKIDKRSARRNRLRRRIREIFRHRSESFRTVTDLVVIALAGSTELNFSEVEEELCSLFKKAGILPRSATG